VSNQNLDLWRYITHMRHYAADARYRHARDLELDESQSGQSRDVEERQQSIRGALQFQPLES
jgi:hypothetical protein